ncbi:tyrosine-type recombinase/integrase [Candidatus Methylomicrobium oryzae]|jgi:integrase|uniref:tyrosine-type recombinase/integrase n=1 Tax=Candidatus Methylomicrobium oryzae TaxID=2802053 RepID=UPI0019242844|nr:site-specific integrase [Methylomicrobium sp. RS1]MBL1263627.1 site-specific integrase [Methylomicrobium sp. RS1]
MATIEKRTAENGDISFRVKVRLKGYPAQSATFDRLTDAKKWASATESAIREGRHFKTAEAKKHTLGELVDRYIKEVLPTKPKQVDKQKQQLEWWKDKMGAYILSDVTPAMVVQYRDELASGETNRGTTRSPATVVRYMAALSHAFTVAVNEWQWLEDSPMRKVKKPKESRGRIRFLDDDERERFLTACQQSTNDWLYLCVILALSTGMRQRELMGLKWQDVNLKDGFIILHETKNGERRRVPLAGHGLDLLHEHAKVRRLDTDLLFPGKTHKDKPIDLRKPFETALKQAEITDFHWHDLRHCTASYLAMDGASLAEIAEILGHKTLQMVKRYAHLSDGHVSNVVASMNAKIFGGTQ